METKKKMKPVGATAPELMSDQSSAQREAIASLGPWLEYLDLVLQKLLTWLREHEDDRLDMAGILLPPMDESEEDWQQSHTMPYWQQQTMQTPWLDGLQVPLVQGRLADLVDRFGLTPFETRVLILSALPLFDARYGSIYAYLQNDNNTHWPGVELALTLFSTTHAERIANRLTLLSKNCALSRHELVQVSRPGGMFSSSGSVFLRLDDAVFHFICGERATTLQIGPGEAAQWASSLADAPLNQGAWAGCAEQIARLCFGPDSAATPTQLLLLQGGYGREALVAQLGQVYDRPVLSLDLSLLPVDESDARALLHASLQGVRLYAGVLLVQGWAVGTERHPSLLRAIEPRFSHHGLPVICLVSAAEAAEIFPGLSRLNMTLPLRSNEDDVYLLSRYPVTEAGSPKGADQPDWESLLTRTRVNPDALTQIWQEAQGYRMIRAPDAALEMRDLTQALNMRGQQNFKGLTQRIRPQRTFNDLIVSDKLSEHLHEILAAIRHRDSVLDNGFMKKVGYGTGISALFYGQSGTGKTMAAEVLAGELGVDLIRVDLSTVVNKYIGETEKNLSRIFDLATADNGVLLFDEADALFGKRSETKDSQDRHANIEVSYLLQRLEQYPGLVVLTTNNRSHLDNAFTRRLTFIANFEAPDAALRERMWREIWPKRVNIDDDVDWAQWAGMTDLTGAGIRNVALLASWLAAENDRPVSQADISRAVQRELDKSGKIMFSTPAR